MYKFSRNELEQAQECLRDKASFKVSDSNRNEYEEHILDSLLIENTMQHNVVSKSSKEVSVACCGCSKVLGELSVNLHNNAYKGMSVKGTVSLFCNEGCYIEHWDSQLVEEYKGERIYWVNVDGRKVYIPYRGCNYGFENIEDCKKRIDTKYTAVI